MDIHSPHARYAVTAFEYFEGLDFLPHARQLAASHPAISPFIEQFTKRRDPVDALLSVESQLAGLNALLQEVKVCDHWTPAVHSVSGMVSRVSTILSHHVPKEMQYLSVTARTVIDYTGTDMVAMDEALRSRHVRDMVKATVMPTRAAARTRLDSVLTAERAMIDAIIETDALAPFLASALPPKRDIDAYWSLRREYGMQEIHRIY